MFNPNKHTSFGRCCVAENIRKCLEYLTLSTTEMDWPTFFCEEQFCDVCDVQLLGIDSDGANTTQRFQEKPRRLFSAWEPE